jgi:predicted acetyltransferase
VSLRLSEADPRHQASYLDALRELSAEGNSHYLDLVLPPEPGFPGVGYTLQTLGDPAVFEEFCAYNRALADPSTPRPAGWVTGTYLWMLVDDVVVGRISLRHTLTPWLLQVGGHIGYAVRPSARRRGYATAALGRMLPVAAGHGIDPVLVTCDQDNIGSRRTIEANGGVLEDVRGVKRRYWVPTKQG